MQKLIKIFTIILLLVFSNSVFAQLTKEEAFSKMKEKFAGIKAISFSFTENSNKGTIKAAKGNKFIITVNDRKIICNGKDVWNYSITDKKVMVSEYENSSALANLDEIFLNFATTFTPLSIIKENSSKSGGSNVLVLQNSSKTLKDVSEIKIYSQGNFDDFSSIEIKSKNGTKKYGIKNLQINPKIKESAFNFETPKDVELIDLR